MSTNSASSSEVFITWAMPLSVPQLGARLFAYTETRATMTTFRTVTACHNLPEEVISSIASKVRDIAFKQRMKEWVKIGRCLDNTCTTLFHVPKAVTDSLAGVVTSNRAEDDEWLAEQFADEAYEAHQKAVRRYCAQLMNLNGSSRLAKCARIFTPDFGIHPYFMIRKFYDFDPGEGHTIAEVQAEAYLTLPLLYAPVSSNPGPRAALFFVSSVLNPSALVGPTQAQLEKFKKAANILNLHVYDPDEDDTVFEEKPRVRKTTNSDEDSGSWGSEDGEDDGNGAEDDGAGSDDVGDDGAGDDGAGIDGVESNGAGSNALKSDKAVFKAQQTVENIGGDINTDNVAPKPTTDRVETDIGVDVDAQGKKEVKEEKWPQLMILGCGKLEVQDLKYY